MGMGIPLNEPSRCLTCGGLDGRIVETPRDLEYGCVPPYQMGLWRCRSCGTEQIVPRPKLADLGLLYPRDYQAYVPEKIGVFHQLAVLRQRVKLRTYRKALGSGPISMFDVGAGDARHAAILTALDPMIKFFGVELNAQMAARARASGWAVEDGTIEMLDMKCYASRFHVVTMNHVLEHVLDPALVLRRCSEMLRPGGLLAGEIPVVDSLEHRIFGALWGGYHFPRHLQIPSRSGLAQSLAQAGFEGIQIRTTAQIQSAVSMQNKLATIYPEIVRTAGRSRIYPLLAIACLPFEFLSWVFDIGSIVRFQARKPS